MSIPVVIAENGQGFPVKAVDGNAPSMIVAENGLGAPIVLSDNGAPFIVNGAIPQPPLVPGPLDFVLPGNGVFTNFSREFALAAPDVIVYFACNYTGNPVISIAHGGETLTIVRQDREPVRHLLSLIAVGRGLTLEAADLTITATGGELNAGAGRITEMVDVQAPLSGWTDGAHGNNPPLPLTQTGTSGGTLKVVFVNGGADRSHTSRVEGVETKFSGYTVAGEPYPYDVSVNGGNWVLGEGWSIEGDALVHTGRTSSTCTIMVPAPFYTDNGRRAFIETGADGSGWLSEGSSNTSGVGLGRNKSGYVVGGAIGTVDRIVVGATGEVRISQIEWFINSQNVAWVFASGPASEGGVLTPMQAYRPYWVISAAEVLGEDY